MSTFQPVSAWIQSPPTPTPSLSQDLECDVVIIGAGYTGLTSAIALRKQGLSVVLLEREFAGHGASGRNAGHLTPTIGKDLPSLITFFGRKRAKAILHYAESSVIHTEELIKELGIDCDYVPSGNILAGVHPSQEKKLRKFAKVGQELGGDVEFLSPGDMRERGLPKAFLCGILEKRGGILDPGKLVLGLRQAALDAGATLYENTSVTRIVDGKRIRVETASGNVSAEKAILATNAFTRSTGRMKNAVLPLTVTLLTTHPLTPDEHEAVGWPGKEGIYTAHEIVEGYKVTADNRISYGTKTARYAFGGGYSPEDHVPTANIVEHAFRERFPELGDIEMDNYWSGHIAMPIDFLPNIGVTGKQKNLYYSHGYAGHGLAQACFAGEVMAAMIGNRPSAAEPLLNRMIIPTPPEPFAWAWAKGLLVLLSIFDARLDKKIQRDLYGK